MKQTKRFLALLMALLALATLCACGGKGGSAGGGNSGRSGNVDFTLSAEELNDAFDSDNITASAKYVGRTLAVTGKYEKIDLLSDEVRLRFGGTQYPGVECVFPRKALSSLQALQPGQTITVTGTSTGMFSYVMLEDCKLSFVEEFLEFGPDMDFDDGLHMINSYEELLNLKDGEPLVYLDFTVNNDGAEKGFERFEFFRENSRMFQSQFEYWEDLAQNNPTVYDHILIKGISTKTSDTWDRDATYRLWVTEDGDQLDRFVEDVLMKSEKARDVKRDTYEGGWEVRFIPWADYGGIEEYKAFRETFPTIAKWMDEN